MANCLPRWVLVASLACAHALAAMLAAGEELNPAGVEFFEGKIRPVLVQHCYECHSEQAVTQKKLKGGLLLDSRDGLLKGGEGGPAIVPGKPQASALLAAMRHESVEMPPKGKLPDEVIADFGKWIEMGAPDPRSGGALASTKTIDLAAAREYWAFRPLEFSLPPVVNNGAWVKTDIDRFILAELEAKSLAPQTLATQEKLIRRAAYDLCGLPPTPAELEAFAADNSPDAYGKLVDRLLSSPRYGERWARHWLDIARFGESSGYEFDKERDGAFHYRDFVIRALNDDMPYDKFVHLQIAGDRLQPGDFLAETATGYIVAGPYPGQTTAKTLELIRYNHLDDMVSTIGSSLLGLSVGCARCHDHKYDPIAQEDYYRLVATLGNTDSKTGSFDLDVANNAKLKAEFDAAHAPLAAALAKYEQETLPSLFEAWLSARPPQPAALALGAWHHAGPFAATDFNKAFDEAYPPEAGVDLAQADDEGKLKWVEQPEWKDGVAHGSLAGEKTVHYLYRTLESPADMTAALALGGDESLKLWLNGKLAIAEKSLRGAAGPQLQTIVRLRPGRNELLLKVVSSKAPASFYFALTGDGVPGKVAPLLAKPHNQWTAAERQQVLDWWKTHDPEWVALNQRVADHLKQPPKLNLTSAFVATNRGGPVHFLIRGEVERKRELAQPGFVQALIQAGQSDARWLTSDAQAQRTSPAEPRIALAKWLTDTECGAGNLLARVIVNRVWQQHFGRGLVATPNDFGTRGDPPSHPALLDWLAGELVRGGWKLKPIHRLIMTSAVYMQASDTHAAGLKADPQNVLLWHRPVRRLEAEVIRDAILFVSGALDEKMYGPGSLDENGARRSVYLTIKRSRLVPWMQAFDAPDAIQSAGSRPVTTVPAQSLALMNSPLVRSRAEKLAQRVAAAQRPLEESLAEAFRIALSRQPTAEEHAELVKFVQEQTASYGASGQTLALADACQMLLCMNEFVYID